MPQSILRLPAFSKKIGLARSTIYDKLNPNSSRYDSEFPKPIKLGYRAIGFLEEEADAWLSRKIETSRSASA